MSVSIVDVILVPLWTKEERKLCLFACEFTIVLDNFV